MTAIAAAPPRTAPALLTEAFRAFRIPFKSGGSSTLRREGLGRGLEADVSFFLRDFHRLRDPRPEAMPVPELAIEVEVTRAAVDKLPIYAALGVPEVWRHGGQGLTVHVLGADGQYAEAGSSPALPRLPVHELPAWIARGHGLDELAWGEQVQDWLRIHAAAVAPD